MITIEKEEKLRKKKFVVNDDDLKIKKRYYMNFLISLSYIVSRGVN